MDEAIESVNAERGFIVLTDEQTGALEAKTARQIDRAIDKELSEISQTALKEVLAGRKAKVYLDARGDFPAAQSVIIGQIRSIACVPLVCKERLVGAIYVDTRTDKNVFDDDTLVFLEAFANIAALAIENARLCQTLASENSRLRAALREWHQFPEIVGRSKPMAAVYDLMNRVIPADAPVLIHGETGTGKELVARAIHYNGPRSKEAFVPVNCGAIPENLLESELFGYRKGAFTGAVADKKGLFQAANGGTLFLDEIADLPLMLQPKLLRVLQDGEVRRIGDTDGFHVDVRIISATNREPADLVKQGKFREDLYYRLNVIPISLPPLRRRRADIPLLANHFLQLYSERTGKRIAGISRAALSRLTDHPWPGNIRELENTIERAVVLCAETEITEQHLIPMSNAECRMPNSEIGNRNSTFPLAQVEKAVILERLDRFDGNRTRAAESLGISRRTLQTRLAEWKECE